jgi:hypothetical protein
MGDLRRLQSVLWIGEDLLGRVVRGQGDGNLAYVAIANPGRDDIFNGSACK